MKLLIESSDGKNVARIANLMRENGIAVHHGMQHSNAIGANLTLSKKSLWVVYDYQYEDAKSLINNPKHIVKTKIDIEAYDEFLRDEQARSRMAILRIFLKFALFVVSLFAAAAILIVVLQR